MAGNAPGGTKRKPKGSKGEVPPFEGPPPGQPTPLSDLEVALADKQAPRYSVGQAAELLGVRPWFLRRLDTLGVVTPARSEGDQRRYSRSQLEQVADAKAMMDDGVSTEGVRRVLALQIKVERLEAELAGAHALLRKRPRHTRGRATGGR